MRSTNVVGSSVLPAARRRSLRRAIHSMNGPRICELRARHAKFLFHFFAQRLNLLAHTGVDGAQLVFHSPQSGIVSAAQLHEFPFEAFPYLGIGIVPVALPALQHRFAHAVEARAVALETVPEGEIQETLRVVAGNCGVLEIRLARRRTEPL